MQMFCDQDAIRVPSRKYDQYFLPKESLVLSNFVIGVCGCRRSTKEVDAVEKIITKEIREWRESRRWKKRRQCFDRCEYRFILQQHLEIITVIKQCHWKQLTCALLSTKLDYYADGKRRLEDTKAEGKYWNGIKDQTLWSASMKRDSILWRPWKVTESQ